MSNIVPFSFEESAIRIVQIDGEPWFVGKDVAEVLGYADTTNAMKQHCRGVVKRHPIIDALGRPQEARILSEPDVLRLIMSSRLPAAERFERWVFEEVLPTLRRTGSYGAAPVADPMAVLNDPAAMRTLLLGYTERVIALETTVAAQKPKADVFDRLVQADGAVCITVAAKNLQIQPKELFRWLQEHEWIYRRAGGAGWVAYQVRLKQGVLVHKVTLVTRGDGSEKQTEQVLVTPKGLAKLAEALELQVA